MISASIFIQQIFVLFLGVVEIFIGLFILLNNPKSLINRSFFFFILGIAGWIIGVSILYLTHLFIFDKLVFISVFFMITGLVVFTKTFPYDYKIEKKFYWIFLPWILLYLGLPFNLFIKGISVDINGRIQPNNGPLFIVFLILFASYIILSIFLIVSKYRKAVGLARIQLNYLFLGIGSFAITAFIFNIFFPAIGIYQFNLLGPAATIIFVTLTAYAIVVHHLMDIWLVVRLGTVFTIIFAIISIIFNVFVSVLSQYIGGLISLIMASFLITISFEPLKKFIEDKTDKIFFRKHFKIEDVIDELTSVAHQLELNLNKISATFNEIISRYFKVERVGVAILTPKGSFLVNISVDGKFHQLELAPDNPMVEFFNANPNFIFNSEEISKNIKFSDKLDLPVKSIELAPRVYEEMEQLNFVLAAPIEFREQLIGIYFIGEKKSKDLFIPQELKLLDHLIGEAGGLINNARLYEDLKKLDEAKSNFISVVSHQLRTPLSAMRWSTELLLAGEIDKSSQKEFLEDNYKNSIFMIYHLDDMLTALDIGDRKIILKKELCDCKEIINSVLSDNAQTIKSKRLEVKIDLAESVSRLLCDSKKLKKIMEVLLSNAIHYAPASGGRIEIGAIEKTADGKRFLEFFVKDNGIGIAAGEERYIFEKFFRGEEAKKAVPNGFGLGLYIVKSFVKALGGEIYFDHPSKINCVLL